MNSEKPEVSQGPGTPLVRKRTLGGRLRGYLLAGVLSAEKQTLELRHLKEADQPLPGFLGGLQVQREHKAADWTVEDEIDMYYITTLLEVKDGVPHDYLNMNKDGDSRSSEIVEFLVGYAEKKLNELPPSREAGTEELMVVSFWNFSVNLS